MRHLLPALIIALFFAGCTTTDKDLSTEQELVETPDFPTGKYVHAVDIEVPGHGSWQMQGVLKLAVDGIHMMGLSPMGTTVFKIDDGYKNDAKIEVFQPELKPYEEKILNFYLRLRPHLAGRRMTDPAVVPEGWDVKFYPSKKNPSLPPTIAIRSEQFSLRVEVDQYEP